MAHNQGVSCSPTGLMRLFAVCVAINGSAHPPSLLPLQRRQEVIDGSLHFRSPVGAKSDRARPTVYARSLGAFSP